MNIEEWKGGEEGEVTGAKVGLYVVSCERSPEEDHYNSEKRAAGESSKD